LLQKGEIFVYTKPILRYNKVDSGRVFGSMKTSGESGIHLHYASDDLAIRVFNLGKGNVLSVFSHAHPEYEFLIPVTPIPYLLVNRALFFGECGKIYLIPSQVEHGIASDLFAPSYITILIRKEFFEEVLEKIGRHSGDLRTEFEITPKLNNFFQLFKEEVASRRLRDYCLRNLATLVVAELIMANTEARTETGLSEYHYVKTIKESADYIINNIHREITIDELASLCNLSRFHYIRAFKKCFGIPPYQYLMKMRLSVAKLLLESTNLSMTEISSKSGFLTPNRFSEFFKQKMKMTPTEYRRLFNKNYQPSLK